MNKKWLRVFALALVLVFSLSFQVFASSTGESDTTEAATEAVTDESDAGLSENAKSLKTEMVTMVDDAIKNYTSEEQVQSYIDEMTSQYAQYYDEEALNGYFGYLLSWVNLKDSLGDYVGVKDFTCVEEKEIISSAVLRLEFKEADVDLIYSMEEDATLPTFTLEKNASFGEKMEKAALNTLMGMGTVFLVLIFISVLISGFKVFAKKEEKTPVVEAKVSPVVEEPIVEEDVTDDLELVAVISAAIAEAEGTSVEGFCVRSIKKVKNSAWKNVY